MRKIGRRFRLPATRGLRVLIAVAALLIVAMLAGAGYYFQAITGHLWLMLAREPIDEVIARPDIDGRLRDRLELVLEVREFATRELALPDSDSYRSYVELDREQLLWSVTAIPEFSVQPRQWCYPIIGCQSYRSYYSEERARRLAKDLEAEGFDAIVYPVGSYSTLGWFADPVTDIMLRREPLSLAELIFHELSHGKVFVRGDTMFNESYATFVGRQGVREWLRVRGEFDELERLKSRQFRVRRFNHLLRQKRAQLAQLYTSDLPEEAMRRRKSAILDSIRRTFEQELVADDPEMAALSSWFDRPVTNARLASIALYRHWILAFEELYRQHGGDWQAFHDAVQDLAELPDAERQARLNAFLETARSGPDTRPAGTYSPVRGSPP